jgi:ATP-binding protein involved in chromosome partitioning
MAAKVHMEVKGVIENMSWFTGDDGTRYELFGQGGGQSLADELGVPLLAQIPLLPPVREGSDEGKPVVAVDPDGEAGRMFTRLAERVAVELRPKKVFRPELTIR